MKVVRYEDRLLPKPQRAIKNPRIACVSVLYILEKPVNVTYRPWEIENFQEFQEDKREVAEFTLACYKHFPSGMSFDLHFVDHSPTPQEWTGYPTHRRENEGFSFGGYKWFAENFRDYDYYFFHEMDIAPAKRNWLKEIYALYTSSPDIGVIGNYLEERNSNIPRFADQMLHIGTNREQMYNLDGAFHFVSRQVLDQITLPIFDIPTMSEIAFQQPILELGYKMIAVADSDRLYTYGHRMLSLDPDIADLSIKRITPTIHVQATKFIPKLREHFSWFQYSH